MPPGENSHTPKNYFLLERINGPDDLKALTNGELKRLAKEIRQRIIEVVATNGGHMAPNLGVVELTIALHYAFNSPRDKIVWDVGHQCYAHKLLTGRGKRFDTLRTLGGVSGYPSREESPHDAFGTGHASTSISAALGLAKARDLAKEDYNVIAVIGDGALTGGMAFEGLNYAGFTGTRLIVVLNDNGMSISPNVGAVSAYTNRLAQRITSMPIYHQIRGDMHYLLDNLKDEEALRVVRRLREAALTFLGPGVVFEELGYTYIGPVDGHDLSQLIEAFEAAKRANGPVLVHVRTVKGCGFEAAQENPTKWHGVSAFTFNDEGEPEFKPSKRTFTDAFADAVVELARDDERIVGVTAAMPTGTGLIKFAQAFPERFFDVGIAEQTAVTFASGLAASGLKPVVAIYSTFLQRAYDQVIHDAALQRLHVVLALDRAGIVGDDGPTHNGVFDLAYLRCVPHVNAGAPVDERELRQMLSLAVAGGGVWAIRYPRCALPGDVARSDVRLGEGEVLEEGSDVAIVALGYPVAACVGAVARLRERGISATLVNARWLKPLDEDLIVGLASRMPIVTVEEGVASGGFGGGVAELLARAGVRQMLRVLAIPDEFTQVGARDAMLARYGLTSEGIAASTEAFLRRC